MDTLNELDIVRAVPAGPTVEPGENLGVLRGHFSVFDTWYEVRSVWEGQFFERVAPGAFKKTMRENRVNMRVLYDHGYDPQIGNKVLGTIADLREDDVGAYFEVDLFDTSYTRDLLPGLQNGAYGASFRFQVVRDTWDHTPKPSDANPTGLPERTIKETMVAEFGPVTFPASPMAKVGMRSLTDAYYQLAPAPDRTTIDALLAEARLKRTSPIDPTAVDEGDAAMQGPSAPAVCHPEGMTPAQRRERLTPFLRRSS